jgi:hypothetical protein
MITLRDSQIQSRICTFIRIERPYTLAASDAGIMKIVDYDLSEAERQLEIWMSNHPDDFMVLGKNPLSIKIYPTFFEDPEQKAQRDIFIKMRERRYGR